MIFFQHDLRQDGEADPFYKRQNKTKDPGVIRYRGVQLSKSMKETSFNLKFSEIARPFVSILSFELFIEFLKH